MKPLESGTSSSIAALSRRSLEIFRRIVDAYVTTGVPVGSRTLSRQPDMKLSPATIRNVMADLEEAGLIYAPHTSAGRLPTELGLRFFVDGLMEFGNLSSEERASIDSQCAADGRSLAELLSEATTALSGLSHCTGLVLAPKLERPLKHIEFVSLGPGRTLVVLVTEDGAVENRIIDTPLGLPPSSLVQAGNYLNARLAGTTLGEAREAVLEELEKQRAELDILTSRVVEAGLASWADDDEGGRLIVRGRANLLEDVTGLADLERIRALFDTLETRETLVRLLESVGAADGVQIFIGAEAEAFGMTGMSMIIAPYGKERGRLVGAIGVIGPTRINYARIVPMVDYTAQVIGRLTS